MASARPTTIRTIRKSQSELKERLEFICSAGNNGELLELLEATQGVVWRVARITRSYAGGCLNVFFSIRTKRTFRFFFNQIVKDWKRFFLNQNQKNNHNLFSISGMASARPTTKRTFRIYLNQIVKDFSDFFWLRSAGDNGELLELLEATQDVVWTFFSQSELKEQS